MNKVRKIVAGSVLGIICPSGHPKALDEVNKFCNLLTEYGYKYGLIKAMREQNNFNMICVGDDWQSIYQFTGSDIGYIINFEEYWGLSDFYPHCVLLREPAGHHLRTNWLSNLRVPYWKNQKHPRMLQL